MITLNPFFVIAFAGLLHASFQLGVSLLTLLGGHSLGSKKSFQRLMQLNLAYVSGATVITILLFCSLSYIGLLTLQNNTQTAWFVLSLLNMIIGISVMVFYYRKEKGTGLWIPRPMAKYLTDRTKKTKHSAEAFTLGAGSVLAEIPFLIGPLSIAVLYTLTQNSASEQALGMALYSLISLAPLLIILGLVGSGHKISSIQRWREDNKLFLQYCAGSGLVILGGFVFVDKFLGGTYL